MFRRGLRNVGFAGLFGSLRVLEVLCLLGVFGLRVLGLLGSIRIPGDTGTIPLTNQSREPFLLLFSSFSKGAYINVTNGIFIVC